MTEDFIATEGLMNWKRRMRRNLLFALFGGVATNAVYFGFLYTTSLHGFAVGALGPAIDIVNHYLDRTYAAGSYRYLEEFAVNIILYAFWIMLALVSIDLLILLKRKLVP